MSNANLSASLTPVCVSPDSVQGQVFLQHPVQPQPLRLRPDGGGDQGRRFQEVVGAEAAAAGATRPGVCLSGPEPLARGGEVYS